MNKKKSGFDWAIKLVIIVAVVFLIIGIGSKAIGNRQIIDLSNRFDVAIIQLANGDVVEVKIKSWKDYDGEQIQIVAEDGTVYLTNSFRCDLINSKEE